MGKTANGPNPKLRGEFKSRRVNLLKLMAVNRHNSANKVIH
jgi:hypothetical protein